MEGMRGSVIFAELPVGSPLMQGRGVCSKKRRGGPTGICFSQPFTLLAMPTTSAPGRFPKLVRRFRPSLAEVEHYARLILMHEHHPASAWSACVAEAEVHLWAIRSLLGGREDKPRAESGAT